MREGVPSKIWIVVKLKYFIPLTHKQLTKCKSSYLAKQKKPWGEEQFTCAKLIFLYLWSMPKKTKIWSCFVVSNWIAPRKELALSKLNHNNRSENTQSIVYWWKHQQLKLFLRFVGYLTGQVLILIFPGTTMAILGFIIITKIVLKETVWWIHSLELLQSRKSRWKWFALQMYTWICTSHAPLLLLLLLIIII